MTPARFAPEAANPPTTAEVVARLSAILAGDASRAAVADWAGGWIRAEPSPIADPQLWQLLRLAASVDLRSQGRDGRSAFLHADADIRDWIDGAGA
jgi:hypothetical protein